MTIGQLITTLDVFRDQYNVSRDPYVQELCRYVSRTIHGLKMYESHFPNPDEIWNVVSRNFAANYVPKAPYNIGDFCIYEYKLYMCTEPIPANQDKIFRHAHWTRVNITDVFVEQNTILTEKLNELSDRVDHVTVVSENSTEGWNSNPEYIPKSGEICMYTDYYKILDPTSGQIVSYPAVKIGDGNAYLIDLPFIDQGSTTQVLSQLREHENDLSIHVSSEDREFWNNKLNYEIENQNLILTRN